MRLRRKSTGIGEMEAGQDSFLDIVSNIVGILIILVMVAGVRAKSLPPREGAIPAQSDSDLFAIAQRLDQKGPEIKEEFERFVEKMQDYESIQREMRSLNEEIMHLNGLTSARAQERVELISLLGILKTEYEIASAKLSESEKETLEIQQQIREIELALARADQNKQWIEQQRPQATVLENIPTPLTKTVEKNEAHFRVKGGRVVFVPLSACMEEMIREIRNQNKYSIKEGEIVGTIGPIENFKMPYRVRVLNNVPIQTGRGVAMGSRLDFAESEMVPLNEPLGETLSEAMNPYSQFHRRLAVSPQGTYTITFWVYPDSFSEYRELKKYLFEKGYQTAARPLNRNDPIGASSEGTKSTTQ